MNDREFSDTEIFQHSGKGMPLFMTGHKNCLQANYNNGRRILFSKLNEIICVANVSDQSARKYICVANVSDQSARKYKEKFSTEIEDQGSLYPVLKSSNIEYFYFASSHCSL